MSNTSESPPPSLYAAREPVFPRRVHGWFRSLKWWVMAVTLGIYYLTPWIRWDRGPALPDQAVLIDLANRRFYFFWIEIWPYEFYFIAGLLVMAGLGLFLFTSALGRVWCGYACPQTVWTDLYILVERWIEGDRNARLRLYHQKKWDFRKARLRLTKWVVWLLIGLATGGMWVFYFADAPTLLVGLLNGTAHPAAYTTMAILTATTFFFGGFAREQICIYACPWPRIQSAMMDEDTLVVSYRPWRGEPRKHSDEAKAGKVQGDCIDCMACVNVCPMGIDIRNGQQMECITCALCIDACDDVMAKIGKPRGLIDYMALTDEPLERAGNPPKPLIQHVLRPRTIVYTVLWSAIGIALLVALYLRPAVEFTVAPVRNPLYVLMSDGAVRNTYEIRLRNKHGEPHTYRFSLPEGSQLTLSVEGSEDGSVAVDANETQLFRVYVQAGPGSPEAAQEQSPITINVEDIRSKDSAERDTVFHGKDK